MAGTVHSEGEVACVVTCHNYGRYLPECLDSILGQTRKPEHIIVVDDASEDDTPAVCAAYAARGVRYLRTEHRDVAKARNAGMEALPRTKFLLWVDADNILSPDYRERLQEAMVDPGVGVAYAPLRRFDDDGRDLGFSTYIDPYDYHRLRVRNFADAGSLVRREAMDQVGGWPRNSYGLQDWLLWLLITRAGWRMRLVEETHLHYRVHSGAMSDLRRDNYQCGVDVIRDGQLTTLVTLFSGREWMLERYFDWIKRLAWNRQNLHLVAVDNSGDAAFRRRLQLRLTGCGLPHTYVRDDGRVLPDVPSDEFSSSREHRSGHAYQMNVQMARLYALAREHMPARADLVWCVEDDVVPPDDALSHLALGLYRHADAGVVAGCLRSKFVPVRLIAWESLGDQPHGRGFLTEPPAEGAYLPINASGFFCTLFRRPIFDALAFRPSRDWSDRNVAYDWAAAEDVKDMGYQWLLAGSVRCGHWGEDDTCLMP